MPVNHKIKKASRTISGVTPLAIMAKPISCPGKCIFCPTFIEAPKSYTPESPAVLRALSCEYDAAQQVRLRLKVLSEMGHPVDKIELIIMGGTFPASDINYQYQFIKDCYDALNGRVASSLQEAKHINETASNRCVGLCIETRPDWCGETEVRRMLEFGTTRVELGVQTLDDEIYHLIRRGHDVADVIKATKLLKDYGLKVYYHWMPGLPGSNPAHDLEMTRCLFENNDFKPDGLKLYPTLIVKQTELADWYLDGKFAPYSMDETIDLMIAIKQLVPPYVRIPRVMRDIPTKFILAGCKDLALRTSLKKSMQIKGVQCQCTRCREYGHRLRDGWQIGEPQLRRTDYFASDGKEIFLSYEDQQATLFALLRLRIKPDADIIRRAMVREIHVFGSEVPIGCQEDLAAQHKGLGLLLLKEAERIARDEFHISKLAIISGIGAREYFRAECNYQLEEHYMVKTL